MRKNTMVMGLALALSLGGAGIAAAQSTSPEARQDAGAEHRGPGGRHGGPEAMLLKGVTLSSAQKAQLENLRKADRDGMQKNRDAMRSTFEKARAARQSGDTATARSLMEQVRSRMDAQREQRFAAIRSILTPEQQRQFDSNVAEWKQHANDRWGRGGRPGEGGPDGQGGRGRHQHDGSAPSQG